MNIFIKISIFLTVFSVTLLSCKNPLMKDPRLYNKNESTNSQKPSTEDIAPGSGLDDMFAQFDKTDEWYNNPSCNGDDTNPGTRGFESSEFDTMAITGWFNDKNVPFYTAYDKDVWEITPSVNNGEYTFKDTPQTEGQGFKIKNIVYYQYRGKNPFYAADGNYNKNQKTKKGNPLLDRFYFYRFTGLAGGVQNLDNYLMAIDTYSKYVFAFAKPTEFNKLGAPTKWGATDNKIVDGKNLFFFMYDPVGYVIKNPDNTYTIELYDWFKKNLANGDYEGYINPSFTHVARKSLDGAGSSPFFNKEIIIGDSFYEVMKGLSFSYREDIGVNDDFSKDGNGYGAKLFTYKFSDNGKEVSLFEKPWGENERLITNGRLNSSLSLRNNVKYAFENGSTLTFNISKDKKVLTVDDKKYYNTRYFVDKGPAFNTFVKNQSFTYRDENGNGLNKITYSFNNDGSKATVTTTPWLKNPVTAVYNVETVNNKPSQAKVIINGKEVNLQADNTRLLVDSNPAIKDYIDKGPSFINRVKGKTFEGTDTSYAFSADGLSVTFKYKARSGQKVLNLKYSDIEHPGNHGIYDKYGMTLFENDTKIMSTSGTESFLNSGTKNPAILK